MCSRHGSDRRDPMGQSARQRKRHASTIRHSVGIDARRIDVVLTFQLVNQIRNECDVQFLAPVLWNVSSRRVDDNETVLIGQVISI